MYLRVLLASLATSVWYFFGGWVIYGMLLMDYYTSHTIFYEGMAKEHPDMIWLVISCFAPALLISLMVDRTSSSSLKGGAVIGAVVGFFLQLTFTSSMLAFYNIIDSSTVLGMELSVGTLFYAVGGAIAGLILGMKKG